MKQLSFKNKLRLSAIMALMLCCGSIYAQDDLQEYINTLSARSSNRAPADVVEVDLSKFTAVNRETTLDVANGRNFRFINGKLTRAASLDGPIIHIGGGSWVAIGDGANIDASSSTSSREVIFMDGGELETEANGKITAKNNCNSIVMTTDNDAFTTNSGSTVTGTVACTASNANITYAGGSISAGTSDNFISASDINFIQYPVDKLIITLTRKSNVVNLGEVDPPYVTIKAPAKVSGDVIVKATRTWIQRKTSWEQRIKWAGNAKYQIVGDAKKQAIKLSYDDLQEWIYDPDDGDEHCGCSEEDPYILDVPCDGMAAKKDIDFPDDDLYWFINGQPEGQTDEEAETDCEKTVNEDENNVYIRPKAHVYIRRIHWRGCGCQKHFWVWGTVYITWRVYFTYYWRFIHVMPGGHVIIKDLYGNCDETVFHIEGGDIDYSGGRCTGGKYGWYSTGGTVYIRGGWLGGGICGGWTGVGGTSYHYGGTIHGGIHNYGRHYWYGGICTGGGSYTIYNYKGGHFYYYGGTCTDGGRIWNEGDLYIDGGGEISYSDIYCVRGCHIYILKKLTFILRLYIDVKNIVLGQPIVLGGGDYTLTAEDCKNIVIDLPEGYEWKYDEVQHAIIISSKSDTNDDDTIDVADIAVIINYMAGNMEDIELKKVDANGDGVVDVADIATVINMMAKK